MTGVKLTKTRIQSGRYEALLTSENGAEVPRISATYLGRPLDGLTIEPSPDAKGSWFLSLEIPAEILADGIQTILLMDLDSDETLDSFTIITGEPVQDDLRGEIDLLRAELNMLKKAFRRHCLESQ